MALFAADRTRDAVSRGAWSFAAAVALICAATLCPSLSESLAAQSAVAPATAASVETPNARGNSVGADRSNAAGNAGAADGHSIAGLSLSSDKGPIDIKSDSLSLDYKGKTVIFRGHVRAVQSATELTSDLLQISYGKDFNDVQQVVADHDVKITQGGRWATGDHAVLDQTARTVEMTGNPVIHDGLDQITGSKILIYLDSQKSVVEGARAVIFPRTRETRDNEAYDHATGPKD